VMRVAVLRDPTITAGIGLWGAILSVSPAFGVELRPIDVRDAGEIERALTAFSRSPNGGLILTGSAMAIAHRDLIIALAARHQLPAIYYEPYFAAAGGLIAHASRRICRSSNPRNSSWSSTSTPRRPSASDKARVHHAARRRGGCVG